MLRAVCREHRADSPSHPTTQNGDSPSADLLRGCVSTMAVRLARGRAVPDLPPTRYDLHSWPFWRQAERYSQMAATHGCHRGRPSHTDGVTNLRRTDPEPEVLRSIVHKAVCGGNTELVEAGRNCAHAQWHCTTAMESYAPVQDAGVCRAITISEAATMRRCLPAQERRTNKATQHIHDSAEAAAVAGTSPGCATAFANTCASRLSCGTVTGATCANGATPCMWCIDCRAREPSSH